ncbi:MAG: hypothetical protein M3Y17_06165 [Actinomycetota bacterium]|nr:hypothetical protein [Actinomycetota bacterium]
MKIVRTVRLGLAALIIAGTSAVLASPSSADASTPAQEPRSLAVVATEYHFALSSTTVHAGLVTIHLRNHGYADHSVQLARLHPGATEQQFLADVRAGKETSAYQLVDFTGGVNAIAPGAKGTAFVRLPSGRYLAADFVPGPRGVRNLLLGLVATLRVTGAMDDRAPARVRGSIDAYSFGFSLPQRIEPHGVYRFADTTAPDPHELLILRLAPGKTIIDFVDWLQIGMRTVPPFTPDGGATVVEPHREAWIQLNLQPGDYIATCFVRDTETGMPHALMGMITPFHVGATG